MGLFNWGKKNKDKNERAPEELSVPTHIAIIPDGNRRWARKRLLPVRVGHHQGAETFKKIVRYAQSLGVKYVTFYAFSTENWKRAEAEVSALMKIMLNFLINSDEELGEDRDRLKIEVIGDTTRLSEELQHEIARVKKDTENNPGTVTIIALNYGGRDEITNCVRKIAEEVKEGELEPSQITEETISSHLYTAGTPDPDLLIRTSGEQRISNYLLWQMAYTEFYFSDKLWPDFDKEDLDAAIAVYNSRDRRYGGTK